MNLLPASLLLPQRTVAAEGAVLRLTNLAAEFGSSGVLVHGCSLQRSELLDAILNEPPFGMRVRAWRHAGNEPTVDAVMHCAPTESRPSRLGGGGRRRQCNRSGQGGGGTAGRAGKHRVLPDAPGFNPPGGTAVDRGPYHRRYRRRGYGGVGADRPVANRETIDSPPLLHAASGDPRSLCSGPVVDTRAAAGFDAFVQAFESYTSLHATPFTRVLSELALTRIARALLPFYQGNSDLAGEMLEASYLAGVALSHARLGIIHGLAHPLGVRFNVAHGLACACCLPACLAFNRKAVARDLNTLKSQHGLDVEAQIAMG